MLFNIYNTNLRAFLILILCFFSIQNDLILTERVFFILTIISSFFLNKINIKYKGLYVSIYSSILVFIEIHLHEYLFSKNFFINLILLLLILRYADINNKKKLFSYSLISLVICTISLISSQDILSSINSILILIFTIINFYLINQKEIINFDLSNLIKIFGYISFIIPFIIIIYFIFPRVEINVKILENNKSSLGIPNQITLGSFENFADSSKKVFDIIPSSFINSDLYFRVKVFDNISNDKTWLSTKQIKNTKGLLKNQKILVNEYFDIVLQPNERNWIPTLDNYVITSEGDHFYDHINNLFYSKKIIDKKKIIRFSKSETPIFNDDLELNKYTILPDTISNKLVEWAKKHKKEKTNAEYIDFLLRHLGNGNYYYNLSPSIKSYNDYEYFFFNSKEGYCEYYAGIFVILTRLANIPSRIVSGYYGGNLNQFGNFYEFYQKDAHAWAEVWLDGKGWVRIDPTSLIPKSNIINSINQTINNSDISVSGRGLSDLTFLTIREYLSFIDYKWTMSFLTYDKESRDNFVEDFEFKYIWLIFLPVFLFYFFRAIYFLNKKNIYIFLFKFVVLISSKRQKIKKTDTPHQKFSKLSFKSAERYERFFSKYLNIIYKT